MFTIIKGLPKGGNNVIKKSTVKQELRPLTHTQNILEKKNVRVRLKFSRVRKLEFKTRKKKPVKAIWSFH